MCGKIRVVLLENCMLPEGKVKGREVGEEKP